MVEVPISIISFILGFIVCLGFVISLACYIIRKDQENRKNAIDSYIKMLNNIDMKNKEKDKDE